MLLAFDATINQLLEKDLAFTELEMNNVFLCLPENFLCLADGVIARRPLTGKEIISQMECF